ncbi:hypothetical protein I3U41_05885 [Mycobacteroides abscessus subsp. abscessus]|uniref:hypothetical protein n=1 Tax=Mycobacteroides abscessus TaxID=36809 RepID=UPI0019D0A4C3|nr:hypothetical protein [Mycobacteroides abscessus]QSN22139.1 hypothetical protein I3U41_05885 [Mycobacteroides abscessus subsp. abscessus]
MKLQLAVGITAVALLGSACSGQSEHAAPSPSSHSASPGLAPEHVRSVPDDCADQAAKASTRYADMKDVVLAAYRRIPTDQPWSRAFMALSTENVCVVDALSTAWGVDVRGWIYTKGSGK